MHCGLKFYETDNEKIYDPKISFVMIIRRIMDGIHSFKLIIIEDGTKITMGQSLQLFS